MATATVSRTLKLGIVSKPAHCKSHARALKKDGFDVNVLGGSPRTIPPSVDVVILRTESCSHEASGLALGWARRGTGRVIVENGMGGIRRELSKLLNSPDSPLDSERFQRAVEVIRKEDPTVTDKALRQTLQEMGANRVVIDHLLLPVEAEAKPPEPEPEPFSLFPGAYPEDSHWAKAVPERRLKNETKAARRILKETPASTLQTLTGTYEAARTSSGRGTFLPPKAVLESSGFEKIRDLRGRPIRFFLVLLWSLPAGTTYSRRNLQAAYREFTGKTTDGRIVEAAAWVAGHEISFRPSKKGHKTQPKTKKTQSKKTRSKSTLDEEAVLRWARSSIGPGTTRVRANTLYEEYCSWCGTEEEKALPRYLWGTAMRNSGVKKVKSNGTWYLITRNVVEAESVVEPPPVEEAPPVEEETLAVEEAPAKTAKGDEVLRLREEMETHILDLMGQFAELKRENVALRAEVVDLRKASVKSDQLASSQVVAALTSYQSEVKALKSEIAQLKEEAAKPAPPEEAAPIQSRASDLTDQPDVLGAIDALRERGAHITLTFNAGE